MNTLGCTAHHAAARGTFTVTAPVTHGMSDADLPARLAGMVLDNNPAEHKAGDTDADGEPAIAPKDDRQVLFILRAIRIAMDRHSFDIKMSGEQPSRAVLARVHLTLREQGVFTVISTVAHEHNPQLPVYRGMPPWVTTEISWGRPYGNPNKFNTRDGAEHP